MIHKDVIYICLLTQGNNTSQQWKDGSPYAFQLWEQPFISSAQVSTYLLETETVSSRNSLRRRNYEAYIQPFSVPTHKCTAAVYSPSGTIKWMKIPCARDHHSSSYVCEIRLDHKETNRSIFQYWLKQRTGIAVECPFGTFKLLDSCIGF